ncbi:class I SAM-dependent methyltransferase [Nonomuraea sp. NPDC050556]|uniref:class I SAM-dependent methyltransferase n=1 Tax=Nonomuraea sp. NPDC050556 TaxID=3364369 RepID=UPI0037BA1462
MDELIAEALATPFEGWDFGVFAGRMVTGEPPWSYERIVRERLPRTSSLLDLGTGGGELLSTFAPLPARTAATEGYEPNVPIARKRLEPLGVEVREVGDDDVLPFPDASFELILSRHESYDPAEIRRVLTPGGTFVTQQVGGLDLAEINSALGAPSHGYLSWNLKEAVEELVEAGFEVQWQEEARVPTVFHDVGALVLFLRITPWQVPDFDVTRYAEQLRALPMPFEATAHRFALRATLAL